MDQNTFMGLMIGALVVLFGLAATITTLIVKPILKLNNSITKLDDSVGALNKSIGDAEKKIDKNTQDIDKLQEKVYKHDGILCQLKGDKKRGEKGNY